MKDQNVGDWDRNMRLICGSAALLASMVMPLPKGWRLGLLALGATELVTASTRYCPLNKALGINTMETGPADTAKEAAHNIRALVE